MARTWHTGAQWWDWNSVANHCRDSTESPEETQGGATIEPAAPLLGSLLLLLKTGRLNIVMCDCQPAPLPAPGLLLCLVSSRCLLTRWSLDHFWKD